MPTRLIREGINDSKAVNSLSDEAEIFYRRLLNVVDDHGRIECDPEILRGELFKRKIEQWPVERIERCLLETKTVMIEGEHPAPLVSIYAVHGRRYLQVNNFGQRMRSASKCPPMADKVQQMPDKVEPTRAQGRTYSYSDAEADAKPKAEAYAEKENAAPVVSIAVDRFPEFRMLAEQAGMDGGEEDWRKAREDHWAGLGLAEQLCATAGIRARMGHPDDAAIKSLPQNYLGGKKWQRKVRDPTAFVDPAIANKAREEATFKRLMQKEIDRGTIR